MNNGLWPLRIRSSQASFKGSGGMVLGILVVYLKCGHLPSIPFNL